MNSLFKFKTLSLLVTATVGSLITTHAFADNAVPHTKTPKNIIYVVGDGMGPAYTTAYRNFIDNPETPVVERTIFDKILVGGASTTSSNTGPATPHDDEHHTRNIYVTDSAAAATALSAGIKTYNGAIAVNDNKQPVRTVMEYAKSLDKTTAIVVTSEINHATPASFVSHNDYRRNYPDIANDFIDNRVNGKPVVDLMLGGGTEDFVREDRNIANEFKSLGYQYLNKFDDIGTLSFPALGLFAPRGLPFAIDDPANPHRLANMVSHALPVLDNNSPNGFFMLVEGSQIDWCGHANDIACAMREMDDFAQTIEHLVNYVDTHPDTLLVITADHSTGGLTIGADGNYFWRPAVLNDVKASAGKMAEEGLKNSDIVAFVQEKTGVTPTEEQAKALKAAQDKAQKSGKTWDLHKAIAHVVDVASNTGWTTTGHTGVDVQVFAYGQSSQGFIGSQDNTDLAKKLFKILGASDH